MEGRIDSPPKRSSWGWAVAVEVEVAGGRTIAVEPVLFVGIAPRISGRAKLRGAEEGSELAGTVAASAKMEGEELLEWLEPPRRKRELETFRRQEPVMEGGGPERGDQEGIVAMYV